MNRSSWLLALGALFLSATASAELITYDFTAVNRGRFDTSTDTSLHLPPGFGAGAIATGFITFETAIADSDPADATRGIYPGAIVDFQVTIDDYSFDYDAAIPGSLGQIVARDRVAPQRDVYAFATSGAYSTFSPPPGSGYTFTMGLQTEPALTYQVLNGDGIVADLSTIQTSWILTWFVGNPLTGETASSSIANVTSMVQRPASVPEPGTAMLLLTGMLGLAARRKRATG